LTVGDSGRERTVRARRRNSSAGAFPDPAADHRRDRRLPPGPRGRTHRTRRHQGDAAQPDPPRRPSRTTADEGVAGQHPQPHRRLLRPRRPPRPPSPKRPRRPRTRKQGEILGGPDLRHPAAGRCAGAAATSSVIGGQLGVAGTVVGAGVASIVTALAVTLYGRSLDKGKEKIQEVGSKLAPAVKAKIAKHPSGEGHVPSIPRSPRIPPSPRRNPTGGDANANGRLGAG
jgi:hypothetical protein